MIFKITNNKRAEIIVFSKNKKLEILKGIYRKIKTN